MFEEPTIFGNDEDKSNISQSEKFNDIGLEGQKELIAAIHQKQQNGEPLTTEEETILSAHHATVDMVNDIEPDNLENHDEDNTPELDIVQTSTKIIESLEAEINYKRHLGEDISELELKLQEQKDWLKYVKGRDYLDDKGNVHDSQSGKFIKIEDANRDNQEIESHSYEDYSLKELVSRWAYADKNGDKTTSLNIQDAIQEKLINSSGLSDEHRLNLLDQLHRQMEDQKSLIDNNNHTQPTGISEEDALDETDGDKEISTDDSSEKDDKIKNIEDQIDALINSIENANPEEKDTIQQKINELENEKYKLQIDAKGKELLPYNKEHRQIAVIEQQQEIIDEKLSLATLRIGDIATRIREAAERDLMVNVNTGGLIKRLGRKMLKLNPLVREAWLQRRQAQLQSLVQGKSIEDLYETLSSLDSEAKDTATKDLIISLLDESLITLNNDEKSDRKVGTGNPDLDLEIKSKIKEIAGEFLSIENPSPQDRENFEKIIAEYMQGVADSHPELVGMDETNNFMGFGGSELLGQIESLKNQLEETMDHDDAIDRVNSSLDNLELIFGQMQSGANGELAHTKFNDTMEKLKSRNNRLGKLLRNHRGFAVGCAVAFGATAVTARALPSTAARVIGVGTLGVGLGVASYLARKQAIARSETDSQLAQIISATGTKLGEDGEYDIGLDENMRSRQYNVVSYNETVNSFSSYLDIDEESGSCRLKQGLSPEQIDQLITIYSSAKGRLNVQQNMNKPLYSTEPGQSQKGGLNSLSNIFQAIDEGIATEYASSQYTVGSQEVEINSVLAQRISLSEEHFASEIAATDVSNEKRAKADGKRAAIIAPIVGASFAMAAAEIASVATGSGLRNPVEIATMGIFGSKVVAGPNINQSGVATSTVTIGKSNFNIPENMQINTKGNTASITLPNGQTITGLDIDSQGQIDVNGEAMLRQNGLNITQQETVITGHRNISMSSSEYINEIGGSKVKVGNWLDNGTPSPNFDGTELGQNWSVKPNGNLVIRQDLGTAYGNGEAVNVLGAAKKGDLSVYVRTGKSAINIPMEVKGGQVQAVIPKGSQIHRLFDYQGDQVSSNAKFVQVGVNHGAHKFSSISTVLGNPEQVIGKVPTNITGTEITITPIEVQPTPGSEYVPPIFPYGFANDQNRAERTTSTDRKDPEDKASDNDGGNTNNITQVENGGPDISPVNPILSIGTKESDSKKNAANVDLPKEGDTYSDKDGGYSVEILDATDKNITYVYHDKENGNEDSIFSVSVEEFYKNMNSLGFLEVTDMSKSKPVNSTQNQSSVAAPDYKESTSLSSENSEFININQKQKDQPTSQPDSYPSVSIEKLSDFTPGRNYELQTSSGPVQYVYQGPTENGEYRFTNSTGPTVLQANDLEVLLPRFKQLGNDSRANEITPSSITVNGQPLTENNIYLINSPYEGRYDTSQWIYAGYIDGKHNFQSLDGNNSFSMNNDELKLKVTNKNILLPYDEFNGQKLVVEGKYRINSPFNRDDNKEYTYSGKSESGKYVFYEDGNETKKRELNDQELMAIINNKNLVQLF